MTIGVIGNSVQKEILKSKLDPAIDCKITEYTSATEINEFNDIVFDFTDDRNNETIQCLLEKTNYLFVNEVINPLNNDFNQVGRFNGWTSFFERPVLEICDTSSDKRNEMILTKLGIKFIATSNSIGLLSAKVVAMIINEAYFALEEGVSSKEEIDIAMKLGTNYPLGPFEWSEKIGIQKIVQLLNTLSKQNDLYKPSNKLLEEIL